MIKQLSLVTLIFALFLLLSACDQSDKQDAIPSPVSSPSLSFTPSNASSFQTSFTCGGDAKSAWCVCVKGSTSWDWNCEGMDELCRVMDGKPAPCPLGVCACGGTHTLATAERKSILDTMQFELVDNSKFDSEIRRVANNERLLVWESSVSEPSPPASPTLRSYSNLTTKQQSRFDGIFDVQPGNAIPQWKCGGRAHHRTCSCSPLGGGRGSCAGMETFCRWFANDRMGCKINQETGEFYCYCSRNKK